MTGQATLQAYLHNLYCVSVYLLSGLGVLCVAVLCYQRLLAMFMYKRSVGPEIDTPS